MIKSLRKRHREIWSILAVLLPTAIIFSWLVIPNQEPVKLLQVSSSTALPRISGSADLPDYIINLRTNEAQDQWQLEWVAKQVLRVPSAVIYQLSDTSNDLLQSKLIGRIETGNIYRFALDSINPGQAPRFVLYDFIHQRIIDHINIKP